MYYTRTENTENGTAAGRMPAAGPAAVRSAFMRSEEIELEREQSGWNPYAGEEEAIPEKAPKKTPEKNSGKGPDGTGNGRLYFLPEDYTQVFEEEKELERDLRRLQSMYPDPAKQMLPYVEEECDRMEYAGSPMFDEHPDQTTVYEAAERIYGQVSSLFPEEAQEEPEEVLMMQYQGPGRNRPGKHWARELARVLLLQEMHHRRCRRRRCSRRL